MTVTSKNQLHKYRKLHKIISTFRVALIAVMALAVMLPPGSAAATGALFEDDFSPQQPGWSFVSPTPGIMGELNNNENVSGVTLNVTALSAGPATLDFDLLAYRSLDDWTTCCTDTLTMDVNGQSAFTGSFAVDDRFFTNPAGATAGPIHRLPPDDTTITRRISVPVTLMAGQNIFSWSYSPLQSFLDEAWALDNVVVSTAGDTTPPTINCDTADGAWHNDNVDITCTASDSDSGLANPADASFTLSTAVPPEGVDINAATTSHPVCDVAGNCATAGPIAGNLIDQKGPDIAVASPQQDAVFILGQVVAASYACSDFASGLVLCHSIIANGSPIDTSAVGVHSLDVLATDVAGNLSSETIHYTVAHNLCPLYDQSKIYKGATVPIKLQTCDVHGANTSTAGTTITAQSVTQTSSSTTGPVQDTGNANPGNNFNYDASLGGYIFNLNAKLLQAGSYSLNFTIGGSATIYNLPFQIK